MQLITEMTKSKEKILLIGNIQSPLVRGVRDYLTTREQSVIVSTAIPPSITLDCTVCICFTTTQHIEEDCYTLEPIKKTLFVLSTHRSRKILTHMQLVHKHHPHMKFLLLQPGYHPVDAFVERLFAFLFDSDRGIFELTAIPSKVAPPPPKDDFFQRYIHAISHPKHTIAAILLSVAALHFLFFIPYFITMTLLGYSIWQSPLTLRTLQTPTQAYHFSQIIHTRVTMPLYRLSEPGLALFGIHEHVRDPLLFVDEIYKLIPNTTTLSSHLTLLATKSFGPDPESQDAILARLHVAQTTFNEFRNSFLAIQTHAPQFIKTHARVYPYLMRAEQMIDKISKILSIYPSIMAQDTEKTYALFFANNYELRPGGGFIGSFALIRIKNLRLVDWKIYDVYDADGQLTARVAPPRAISTHLHQPFYFLRDSAFTGDFPTNVQVAEGFLQKELKIDGIDGATLVTVHSLEDILEAVGPIKVDEYAETITAHNVYIKTQLYAEKKTFAGSTQKKDFIDALFTSFLLRLSEPATILKTVGALEKSLNAKQIVAYSKASDVQSHLDQWYWSGRQLPYACIQEQSKRDSCILDYTYPLEANLGVNKVNAFVQRQYHKKYHITAEGHVEVVFATTFENASTLGLYPGGIYKNYHQIILPPQITFRSITWNNTPILNYDLETGDTTRIGTLLEIPPQSQGTLLVSYTLHTPLTATQPQLQSIFQKQIGLAPTPIRISMTSARPLTILRTNTTPLARTTPIEYNSTIESDKFYYFSFPL